MVEIPSPAIAVVGRHNSGKTTLVERLIADLAARGFDVGSVKHHTHGDFEIDYPGKDSFRHRAAGATETVIASPVKMARIKSIDHEIECAEIVRSMPGHDIVIVEGYRKSGLPTIEVMRAANERDAAVAQEFVKLAEGKADVGAHADVTDSAAEDTAEDATSVTDSTVEGATGATDRATGTANAAANAAANTPNTADASSNAPDLQADLREKMPDASQTVAIVTDIPPAAEAARKLGIPAFDINDISSIAQFLVEHYTRPRVTVVIQAGGESRRMGQSKALVPFCGRPLICRMVERLRDAADELIITTNEGPKLAFLADEFPDLEIKLQPDKYNFRGALPGLGTALESASSDIVAVVACDMIFASAALVVAETNEMVRTGADVVVPVNKHGFEPFHAAYRKSVCLPAIERAIEGGSVRAQSLFDDEAVSVLEFPQWRVQEVEPRGGCFVNTNTPDELHRIEDQLMDD